MWKIKVTTTTPTTPITELEIECQYLTDMLDAVKDAASNESTISISVQRVWED